MSRAGKLLELGNDYAKRRAENASVQKNTTKTTVVEPKLKEALDRTFPSQSKGQSTPRGASNPNYSTNRNGQASRNTPTVSVPKFDGNTNPREFAMNIGGQTNWNWGRDVVAEGLERRSAIEATKRDTSRADAHRREQYQYLANQSFQQAQEMLGSPEYKQMLLKSNGSRNDWAAYGETQEALTQYKAEAKKLTDLGNSYLRRIEQMETQQWEDRNFNEIIARGGRPLMEELFALQQAQNEQNDTGWRIPASKFEREAYNTRYDQLESRYGKEQLNQWMEYVERMDEQSRYAETVKKAEEFAYEHPGWGFVANVPKTLIGGIGYLDVLGQKAVKGLTGSDTPINYLTPLTAVGDSGRAGIASGAQHYLDEGGKGAKAKAYLYQLGASVANSAAVVGLTAMGVPAWVGTGLLGLSSAESAMQEARARGATDNEALLFGLFSGATEMVMEKLPLDTLMNMGSTKGAANIIFNILKQSGTEGMEEGLTTIANTLADAIIMGDKSELNTMIQRYMADGYSETDAQQKAMIDWGKGLMADVGGGMLSGVFFGVAKTGFNKVKMQNLRFDDAIDRLSKGKLDRTQNTHLLVAEHTPQIFIDKAGAKDLKMITGWDTAYLAMNKNGEIPGHYHGLGADVMKAIPKALEDPLYIVKRKDGRINAITEVIVRGNRPVLVSVELDAFKTITLDGKQEADTYNLIVTFFDAQTNYLQNNVFNGEIKYNKNNEDPAHFISRLTSLKKALPTNDLAGSSKSTVPHPTDSVKRENMEDLGAQPAMGAADSALAKAIAELRARPTGEERIAEAVRLMVEQKKNAEVERAVQELFGADLETYKGTKHEAVVRRTLESAVRAGVSNTGASRAFARFAAKISADLGIPFAFKSGEQIKADFIKRQTEAIANLESIVNPTMEQANKLASMKDTLAKVQSGETIVNGDFTSDGIVLNMDSAKPLNRVVGHEVTHSLENAKYYKELRNALFAYARTKGVDIDSRLADLGKMYEGVANANPEAELIADLVGDYLFTDYDFIQNLSVNHRNVFQKIYDEIKYLCRLVTAGSKEARELEQVKRAFEQAYRAEKNIANNRSVKYSLNRNAKTELHKALYDTNYRSEVLLRDETPAIMLSQKGVKNLSMAMNASHIRENVFTEEEAKKLGLPINSNTHYHGLGEEFFLKIIDGLDDVKLAYRGTKNATNPARREKYFLLVSEFKDDAGNTINVPVYINEHAQINHVFIDVNKISTVFGKRAFQNYINRQIRMGELVRIKNRDN